MSFIEKEYMEYLYNVSGIVNPGTYVYYLRNIENVLNVDIDHEYDKDGCKRLYDTLQDLRKNPERLGKNEVYFRLCASRLKKYMGYRNFMEISGDEVITAVGKNMDSIGDADVHSTRYWLYTPDEQTWEDEYKNGIMSINSVKLGDLKTYDSQEEIDTQLKSMDGGRYSHIDDVHFFWQFAKEIAIGDVIIVKKGSNEIIGMGVVESDYEFNQKNDGNNTHIRHINWTNHGKWQVQEKLSSKILDEITNYSNLIKNLLSLFGTTSLVTNENLLIAYPSYTMNDFLNEVYVDEDFYNTLINIISSKKNIILQGAPGVGKTFVAKRLAYSIMGVKDINRVTMVQFHQSYTYEDFIMGFRPSHDGFELKKGVFYNFCKKAEVDSDHDYFFIIDEINRGNLSKIFGELFMLIENDKRGNRYKLQLLYSDELFFIPENVYIIGMMNTADRSLAMVDYALRRRFAFFDLKPGFHSRGFQRYKEGLRNKKFDALIHCVESLNESIASDESLGEGFCIGHSYFCNICPDEMDGIKLSGIVEFELIPLLREYWFDEPLRVKEWSDNLRSSIK